MDSLDLIRTFHEVAARGSFSRAAEALDMSRANASKYVAELESRFGVRLLNRSTRSVSLTDAGQLLLERSKPLLETVALTQAELEAHASKPRGRVRLTAPYGLAAGPLPSLIGDFMLRFPEVGISLHLSNRKVDLVEEGVDLALRLGRVEEDEQLIVRRLRQMEFTVCASPVYWRKHGVPQHPGELAHHEALTHSLLGPRPLWQFEVDGQTIDVPVHSRMDATDAAPLIELALRGMGVVHLPSLVVQPHIDSGELEGVLPGYSVTDRWLYAAYAQRRHNSAAMRALLDFLDERMTGKRPDQRNSNSAAALPQATRAATAGGSSPSQTR